MKNIFFLLFPILFFSQKKDSIKDYMELAMSDIKNHDFQTAILNLNKSLEIFPNNPSALYFKGYSQIIIGEYENGCSTFIDAIYYNSNSAKKVYAEKCIDYDPKLNIEKFKSGEFSLKILDGNPLVYTFERKNDMQYESYEGKIYSGKIVWLGNGDYKMMADSETKKSMSENRDFIIRVLKIEKNEYLYEKIESTQVQYGIIKKLD